MFKKITLLLALTSLNLIAEPRLTLAATLKIENRQMNIPDGTPALGKNGVEFILHFKVFIKNTSRSVLMTPTAGFTRSSDTGVDYINSNVEWYFDVAPDRSTIIPAASDLRVVSLLPGETAVISWEEVEYNEKRFQNVRVRLVVEKTLADRFNLWSGECETNSVKIDFINRHPVEKK